MKNIIFELSKEHPTLPRSEAIAILHAEHPEYRIVAYTSDIINIEIPDKNIELIEDTTKRLALSFFADELLFSCNTNLTDVIKNAEKHPLPHNKNKSFRVRCINRTQSTSVDTLKFERTLGEIYAVDKKVDLENPDIEIRAILTDNQWYIGIRFVKIDRSQFEKRKVQLRPFFSPISLHPRLARALVNLSEVKKGETLLDPFCGTGGILLEAGLIGINSVGGDLETKMITGCKKTLDYYNIRNYKLFTCDIGKIPKFVDTVDAIATDFPYGKSTTTHGEKLTDVYRRAFKMFQQLLKKGGKAVVGVPSVDAVEIGKKYLKLKETHPYRVHRSLTRYFTVFEKQ